MTHWPRFETNEKKDHHQQEQKIPMMMSSQPSTPTRIRQRIGSDLPYRDNPNGPPQQQWGSGSSPPTAEKSKQKSASSCWKRSYYCCCRPVHGTASSTTMMNDDGVHYEDDFNDMSWSCSIGTSDEDGIWMNRADPAGTLMSGCVWVLFLYSAFTMTFLARTNGIPNVASYLYSIVTSLALACHVKTSLTDPGSVPASAVPTEHHRRTRHVKLSMCTQCQSFKPPLSHHCRICNRCISRMDHHCPWMNNCVGAGNMKHFLLFLIYTWLSSILALTLLCQNYFFCTNDSCMFNIVLIQLARLMTLLSIGSFLFTSSMLMNVTYGIMTGIGTIDRLKKKASNTMGDSDEESIPLTHIFGLGGYLTWLLPIDPIFPDHDLVMGYSTPQRLLREQMKEQQNHRHPDNGGGDLMMI